MAAGHTQAGWERSTELFFIDRQKSPEAGKAQEVVPRWVGHLPGAKRQRLKKKTDYEYTILREGRRYRWKHCEQGLRHTSAGHHRPNSPTDFPDEAFL